MKKSDLSKFIERAVQKEVFAQTVAHVQARNANVPDEAIADAIDDALRQVRAEMWGDAKARKRKAKKKQATAAASHSKLSSRPSYALIKRRSVANFCGLPILIRLKSGCRGLSR